MTIIHIQKLLLSIPRIPWHYYGTCPNVRVLPWHFVSELFLCVFPQEYHIFCWRVADLSQQYSVLDMYKQRHKSKTGHYHYHKHNHVNIICHHLPLSKRGLCAAHWAFLSWFSSALIQLAFYHGKTPLYLKKINNNSRVALFNFDSSVLMWMVKSPLEKNRNKQAYVWYFHGLSALVSVVCVIWLWRYTTQELAKEIDAKRKHIDDQWRKTLSVVWDVSSFSQPKCHHTDRQASPSPLSGYSRLCQSQSTAGSKARETIFF